MITCAGCAVNLAVPVDPTRCPPHGFPRLLSPSNHERLSSANLDALGAVLCAICLATLHLHPPYMRCVIVDAFEAQRLCEEAVRSVRVVVALVVVAVG